MYEDNAQLCEDRDRLYQQLLNSEAEFSANLSWLVEKARVSANFVQLWQVYLGAMGIIGEELFGEDICWNPDSYLVDEVFDKLVSQGYMGYMQQLILGAQNLILQLRPPKANFYANTLSKVIGWMQELQPRKYRKAKWDYIDRLSDWYSVAYGIVRTMEQYALSQQEKAASPFRQAIRRLFRR